MKEPTFNYDGEPTEETLKALANWPHTHWNELVSYLEKAFKGYGLVNVDGDELKLTTGGRSSNEMMIGALKENLIFWTMCWKSSHRGGKFVFDMENLRAGFSKTKYEITDKERAARLAAFSEKLAARYYDPANED